jgi:peroxiredoxin (alkyl hydroperoxide reductase subunit C)
MSQIPAHLPQVGDTAPDFTVHTAKGPVPLHEYCAGCWCIFFAHPANFTSAWTMYSTFLALKERWFNERNTKLLALVNEPVRQNDWSDKVRRYIGIYLKAPIIEDLDFSIANRFGMASGRRKLPGFDRLAFIIDPEGIIRLIIHNPLPSIETAIIELEINLDRLQGKVVPEAPACPGAHDLGPAEQPDATEDYKMKPAYFGKRKVNLN